MLQIVPSIKDFLEEEELKWLSDSLRIEQCILLRKHEIDIETNITKKIVYVFDKDGCFIGKIENKFA